jgi:AcrR family transcriptional regulator
MTKKKLIKITVELAKEKGLINVSCADVCNKAKIPEGTFKHVTGSTFTDFIKDVSYMNIVEPGNIKVTKARTQPVLRKKHIVDIAVELAKKHGYRNINRDMIAKEAGVSGSLISQYFSMNGLRENVMEVAVMREIPEIIAQGILDQNILAMTVSPSLRKKASEIISKR